MCYHFSLSLLILIVSQNIYCMGEATGGLGKIKVAKTRCNLPQDLIGKKENKNRMEKKRNKGQLR